MSKGISVIVPTKGRDSLSATLSSIAPQLGVDDEIIVVGDGPLPRVQAMLSDWGDAQVRWLNTPLRTASWGNQQRDFGICEARGGWLAFCDDDDEFTPDALEIMRRAAGENPGQPHLFRMDVSNMAFARQLGITTLWRAQQLKVGNIGTPMFFCPNDPDRLGFWQYSPDPYAADYWFVSSVVHKYPPGSLVWRDEIVAIVRPAASGIEQKRGWYVGS